MCGCYNNGRKEGRNKGKSKAGREGEEGEEGIVEKKAQEKTKGRNKKGKEARK